MLTSIPDSGIIHLASPYTVAETLDRLAALAAAKGLTLFARIDFAKDAEHLGFYMPPSQLLLLGNPKSGTPLMLAALSTALDLPLKALAWRDYEGQVWLSSNSAEYLQQRHHFPNTLLSNIASFRLLLEAVIRR